MTVDPKTNLMYIADGYGNRRVLIVDAATGKYVGHFGAYGQNPVMGENGGGPDYVCDRSNNRVQIFSASQVGKVCANPEGEAGKCGYVGEIHVAPQTAAGTSGTVNFSTDSKQSCMYIADLTNDTIYVVNRQNLQELGRVGTGGRQAGELHWPHVVAADGEGNLYTGEVDGAGRVQKYLRYGPAGCSGTGIPEIGKYLQ
jgi:DNA-binding beta-propeller fold protein YncE